MKTDQKYNPETDNYCLGMFGVEYLLKGRKATLFDYRLENQKTDHVPERDDIAHGYKSSENIFIFGNGNRPTTVDFHGGDRDDVSKIVGTMSTGTLNGHDGSDLVDISELGNKATIDFQNNSIHTNNKEIFTIKNIEKVIGSEYHLESVICSCGTEYLSMGGSTRVSEPDIITISDTNCQHRLVLHLKRNSIVYCDPLTKGTFTYNITAEGGITIDIKSNEKDAVHVILMPLPYLRIIPGIIENNDGILFKDNLTLLTLNFSGNKKNYSDYNLEIYTPEVKGLSPPVTIILDTVHSSVFHLGKSGEPLYTSIQAFSNFNIVIYTYENQDELEIKGDCMESRENWLIPVNLKLPSKFNLNCGKNVSWMVDLSPHPISNFTFNSGILSAPRFRLENEGKSGLLGSSLTSQTYFIECGSLLLNSGGGNSLARDQIILSKSNECKEPLDATIILNNYTKIVNTENSSDSEFRYILNKPTLISGLRVEISPNSSSTHIFTFAFGSDLFQNVVWIDSSQTLKISFKSAGSFEISRFSSHSIIDTEDGVQLALNGKEPTLFHSLSTIGNKKIKCHPSLTNTFQISNVSKETEKILACSTNDTFLILDTPEDKSLPLLSGGTLDLSQSSSPEAQIQMNAGIGVTNFRPNSEFGYSFKNLEQIIGSAENLETIEITGQTTAIYLNSGGGGDSISIKDSALDVTIALNLNTTISIVNTSLNFDLNPLSFLRDEEQDLFDFYFTCSDEYACTEHLHNNKLNTISLRDIQFLFRYDNTVEVTYHSKIFSFHLTRGVSNGPDKFNVSLSSLSLETEDGYLIIQNRLGTSIILKNTPQEEQCTITDTLTENTEYSLKMGGILMLSCQEGDDKI
ncbi:hypothetical protein Fcan01_28492 [Folsomia candida]|uniref:Uncharacterized protein n=1 Tax=Folsomia candida TaxID=158441 RepID=A0A226CV26_FOLCA|nr:hypothetical protein Fcan01_28492 [Folsomia candida]